MRSRSVSAALEFRQPADRLHRWSSMQPKNFRLSLVVALVGHAAAAAPPPAPEPGPAPAESGSGSAYLSSTQWRVLNAEQVGCQCDNDLGWHVFELDMIDENGDSTRPLISDVQTSSDYFEIARRAVLHDGDFHHIESDDNCGADCVYRDTQGKTWIGKTENGQHVACGVWIGYTFERPVSVRGVHMSQENHWGAQVEVVSLEAWVDGSAWQHVAYVHLASQNKLSDFVGRMDYQDFPGQSPPAQCTQFETGRVCPERESYCDGGGGGGGVGGIIGIAGGVIGALSLLAALLRMKYLQQSTKPSGRAPIPQQQQPVQPVQARAVPMQAVPMQPAVAVAPTQQPAAGNVMVTCPPGLKPGDPMQVSGPGGQTMQVYVPPGTVPGGQFMVQMPAAPAVVQSGFFLA